MTMTISVYVRLVAVVLVVCIHNLHALASEFKPCNATHIEFCQRLTNETNVYYACDIHTIDAWRSCMDTLADCDFVYDWASCHYRNRFCSMELREVHCPLPRDLGWSRQTLSGPTEPHWKLMNRSKVSTSFYSYFYFDYPSPILDGGVINSAGTHAYGIDTRSFVFMEVNLLNGEWRTFITNTYEWKHVFWLGDDVIISATGGSGGSSSSSPPEGRFYRFDPASKQVTAINSTVPFSINLFMEHPATGIMYAADHSKLYAIHPNLSAIDRVLITSSVSPIRDLAVTTGEEGNDDEKYTKLLYIADAQAVTTYDTSNGTRLLLAGNYDRYSTMVDGLGVNARFAHLSELRFAAGAFYLIDNFVLRKMTVAGIVTTLSSSDTSVGKVGYGASVYGSLPTASFGATQSLHMLAYNNTLVMTTRSGEWFKIEDIDKEDAAQVTSVVMLPAGSANGPHARFKRPKHIARRSDGSFVVADSSTLRIVSKDGEVTKTIGVGHSEKLTSAAFVTADAQDNIYFYEDFRIFKIDPRTNVASHYALAGLMHSSYPRSRYYSITDPLIAKIGLVSTMCYASNFDGLLLFDNTVKQWKLVNDTAVANVRGMTVSKQPYTSCKYELLTCSTICTPSTQWTCNWKTEYMCPDGTTSSSPTTADGMNCTEDRVYQCVKREIDYCRNAVNISGDVFTCTSTYNYLYYRYRNCTTKYHVRYTYATFHHTVTACTFTRSDTVYYIEHQTTTRQLISKMVQHNWGSPDGHPVQFLVYSQLMSHGYLLRRPILNVGGIAYHAASNTLYITDRKSATIFSLELSSDFTVSDLVVIAGGMPGYQGDEDLQYLCEPRGITADAEGSVYFVDSCNHQGVVKLTHPMATPQPSSATNQQLPLRSRTLTLTWSVQVEVDTTFTPTSGEATFRPSTLTPSILPTTTATEEGQTTTPIVSRPSTLPPSTTSSPQEQTTMNPSTTVVPTPLPTASPVPSPLPTTMTEECLLPEPSSTTNHYLPPTLCRRNDSNVAACSMAYSDCVQLADDCAGVNQCFTGHIMCLINLVSTSVTKASACVLWNSGLNNVALYLAAGGTYEESTLHQACKYALCDGNRQAFFQFGKKAPNGDMCPAEFTRICGAPPLFEPPTRAPAYQAEYTVVFGGAHWADTLNGSSNGGFSKVIEAAIARGLSKLLSIPVWLIVISDIRVGSLHVTFFIRDDPTTNQPHQHAADPNTVLRKLNTLMANSSMVASTFEDLADVSGVTLLVVSGVTVDMPTTAVPEATNGSMANTSTNEPSAATTQKTTYTALFCLILYFFVLLMHGQ